MSEYTLQNRLELALQLRLPQLDFLHQTAIRLFNGFYEGCPNLVVELFGKTLVIYNYANPPEDFTKTIDWISKYYLQKLPWIQSGLLKTRFADRQDLRAGKLIYGSRLDTAILENGVWYALDLQINQDSGFYLDTRLLRGWLSENMRAKKVLNTFAYTGSLGVAAAAGGATQVLQTDLNQNFLNLAQVSCSLNHLAVRETDFVAGDYFKITASLKNRGELFDCVILDAPFFSVTSAGKIDLAKQSESLINKVRPLIGHDGYLVAINNALYLSGKDYLNTLEQMCQSGYLEIHKIIPVPSDCTGFQETIVHHPPVDPAPFNHPTKIVLLKVHRKDQKVA